MKTVPSPLQPTLFANYEAQESEREFQKALAFLTTWIAEKHGTASEMVEDLIAVFGSRIRMQIPDLAAALAIDPSTNQLDREYIQTALCPAEIEEAMSGEPLRSIPDRNTIDELFRQISDVRKSEKFLEAVEFVSKLNEYAPYNNMLVFLQRPTAKYWATANDWERKFHRQVRKEAIPIIMLQPRGPIMLVFELDDTDGPGLPKQLVEPFAVEGEFDEATLTKMLKSAARDGIGVSGARLSGLHAGSAIKLKLGEAKVFHIELNRTHSAAEQFATLCHELGHIYLGHLGSDVNVHWPSRIGLTRNQRELEAETVAHIVCRRRGLAPMSAEYLAAYISDPRDMSRVSIDMIMKVASKIDSNCGDR